MHWCRIGGPTAFHTWAWHTTHPAMQQSSNPKVYELWEPTVCIPEARNPKVKISSEQGKMTSDFFSSAQSEHVNILHIATKDDYPSSGYAGGVFPGWEQDIRYSVAWYLKHRHQYPSNSIRAKTNGISVNHPTPLLWTSLLWIKVLGPQCPLQVTMSLKRWGWWKLVWSGASEGQPGCPETLGQRQSLTWAGSISMSCWWLCGACEWEPLRDKEK